MQGGVVHRLQFCPNVGLTVKSPVAASSPMSETQQAAVIRVEHCPSLARRITNARHLPSGFFMAVDPKSWPMA